MEFGLSEEQRLLTDNVNRFLDEQAPLERVRQHAKDGDSADIWQGLVALGLPALLVPEDQGGIGLGSMDAALICESLGNHTTPAPYLGTAVLAPTAIMAAGTANGAMSDTLGQIAAGELTIGVALSEATGARKNFGVVGDGKTLSGRTLHVVDYGADAYLVADSERRIYLVAAGAKSMDGRKLATIDTTRTTGELSFSGTPAHLISDNPAVLARVLDVARVMLAADTLGASQNMLDQAVAYAKQREQFNRVIASFQAVKHMCAEMAAKLEPCRSMVWFAGHELDDAPANAPLTACHTKAHLSEVGKFVAKTATEVHGGMGFTDLVGLHYWFKRIGYNRQTLGTPERLRVEAAQHQSLT